MMSKSGLLLLALFCCCLLVVTQGHADHHDHHEHDHHHHEHDHQHDHHEHHDHKHCDHDHHHHESSPASSAPPSSSSSSSSSFVSEFIRDQPFCGALLATVLVSCSSLVVMPFIPFLDGSPKSERILKLLVSSAVGGLLGDVFLHILPHAINPHDHHSHDHDQHHHDHHNEKKHDHLGEALGLGLPILAGFLLFFIAEKVVSNFTGGAEEGHGHSHGRELKTMKKKKGSGSSSEEEDEDNKEKVSTLRNRKGKKTTDNKNNNKTNDNNEDNNNNNNNKIKAAGWLNLIADMLHNFTDGLAIGVSFRTGQGLPTTVAVFFHEVPHNLADFAILIQNGFTKKKALLAQFVSALGSVVGCFVGFTLEKFVGLDLIVAGGFIYIATVDVVPDLLKDNKLSHTLQEAAAMCFGVAMMALMLTME